MLKSQKGITLVALVVTIIILLILAAVTITMTLNGGIFDSAKKAANDYNAAVENEQKLVNELENYVDKYVNGTTTNGTGA